MQVNIKKLVDEVQCYQTASISAEQNSATIWDETAQFLPRKSEDLRLKGCAVYLAKWVVDPGAVSNATTAV